MAQTEPVVYTDKISVLEAENCLKKKEQRHGESDMSKVTRLPSTQPCCTRKNNSESVSWSAKDQITNFIRRINNMKTEDALGFGRAFYILYLSLFWM